jgi:hypothetical protein
MGRGRGCPLSFLSLSNEHHWKIGLFYSPSRYLAVGFHRNKNLVFLIELRFIIYDSYVETSNELN